MGLRVLLADDHKIIRQGLYSLIEQQPDMDVVAQADNGQAAVELALELRPDVVVMDVAMPKLNGIEATQQILSQLADVRIIGLSIHSDRQFVSRMLEAGASAYLLKDCAFEELTRAIRSVTARPSRPGAVPAAGTEHPAAEWTPLPAPALTEREREVFRLVADGRSTRQIADRLNISNKTVEAHRRSIMDKLGVHSVAELTKYALREGLTSLDN